MQLITVISSLLVAAGFFASKAQLLFFVACPNFALTNSGTLYGLCDMFNARPRLISIEISICLTNTNSQLFCAKR
jgi:hypothetical protein